MLDAILITRMQDAMTLALHEADGELEMETSADGLLAIALAQHRANFDLWHEEDKARDPGATDAEILALPSYQTSPLFSELDKLILDYAVGMSRTPVDVPDELFDRLRQHLDDGQLVELTHHIALENMRGRFNLALGIGPAGFSDGMVCAVPAVPP
mgnify:CR=1 FL=1